MLLEGDHEDLGFYFEVSQIEKVDGHGLNVLIVLIEGEDLRR